MRDLGSCLHEAAQRDLRDRVGLSGEDAFVDLGWRGRPVAHPSAALVQRVCFDGQEGTAGGLNC